MAPLEVQHHSDNKEISSIQAINCHGHRLQVSMDLELCSSLIFYNRQLQLAQLRRLCRGALAVCCLLVLLWCDAAVMAMAKEYLLDLLIGKKDVKGLI